MKKYLIALTFLCVLSGIGYAYTSVSGEGYIGGTICEGGSIIITIPDYFLAGNADLQWDQMNDLSGSGLVNVRSNVYYKLSVKSSKTKSRDIGGGGGFPIDLYQANAIPFPESETVYGVVSSDSGRDVSGKNAWLMLVCDEQVNNYEANITFKAEAQ